MLGHGRAFAFVFAFLATMLLAAGAAWGATRYASPTGDASAATTCPLGDECDIYTAIEDPSVNPGDTVIVLPGDYALTGDVLDVANAITVRGGPGLERPRLTRAGDAVHVNSSGATLRGLYIESTSGSHTVFADGGTLEQLVLVANMPADFAATLQDGAVLRDSVATSDLQAGVRTGSTGATMVNVTAVGTGGATDGVRANAADGSTQTVRLQNVIARGSGMGTGIDAIDDGAVPEPDNIDVTVTNSNYSSVGEAPPEADVIEGPGNQTGPPLFANEAAGDFHQLAGSPTIDAGTGDSQLGSADIDGEARSQGAVPDIGADEFVPTLPPAANGDRFPPDTKILKGPKKRTKKRKAKFQFGGSEPGLSFECSLDQKAFKPCDSPEKYRSLKRTKHVFAVRAIDAAGNRDPTPADRKWSIRKKKKR
jgi:hypothetical protein